MKNPFHKDEPDVRVLRQPRAGECGGTTATQDMKAPKIIRSEEMTLFQATSALGLPHSEERRRGNFVGYVSAYAAPGGEGTLLFLETSDGFRRGGARESSWAFVKKDVFPELTKLAQEYDLAKNNGFHSKTHGLPEDFGGSVEIRYADGETISFSNNQSPILSREAGEKIVRLFREWMEGERVALPDVSSVAGIRFEEKRRDGGFTRANLTIHPDGTGTNEKQARYDGPKVYESKKPVDRETIEHIRQTVREKALFAWRDLPDSGYDFLGDKTITFVFSDGGEYSVRNGKIVPDALRDGFFTIELELTTKH